MKKKKIKSKVKINGLKKIFNFMLNFIKNIILILTKNILLFIIKYLNKY